ncbi:MAG: amino acid adenylation domain-containing protein, partial [Lysobacter sp.]|nr:amino acid adenylation domain-containing protein [Lysobacter sp.]
MECETARCIHGMFEDWAARAPDAEAAVDATSRLRYGELNAGANRLARHLREIGVGPGARVGICMDRSVGMLEAIFAIFKAGAAYVPMDPTYPAQRLCEMAEDARPAAVLADAIGLRALASAFAGLDAPPATIDIVADAANWATRAASDLAADVAVGSAAPSPSDARVVPDPARDGDAVAYVIYTSGSTGRPKGVEVTHAAVLHLWGALDAVLFPSMGAAPSPRIARRVAMNAALSFDVSVQGWSRLLSGDCVVVPPQSAKLDPARMLELLEREAVDVFDCTPAQLTGLIDAGLLRRPALAAMNVVVAGEAIAPALWSRVQACDGPRFFNAYGPTEATVYATATAIRDAGPTPHIGVPLPDVRIEILDEARAPVACGEVGELYIGGAGVARGYLHRPELTAERFVADPRRPDARLYRTGDLGRWREDGAIEYLGRNDFQVKIRGFRVELGEVEAAIAQVAGVRDAIALVRDDDIHGRRLIAYYRCVVDADDAENATPGASLPAATSATIRAALAARLPDYMLPAAYVRVEVWPQTVNGKLDRAALPAPSAQDVVAEAFVAPCNDTERALAAMWSEVLGRDAIGRDDRFLALGGDSLRLIQLASRIRAAFAADLPVQALFASRTLADMAETIDRETGVGRDDDSTGTDDDGGFDHWMPPDPLPPRAPLSYQQSGLWLLERLSSTSIAYNAQNVIRIRGAFDPERLRRAVARLAQRHEILRTTFHDETRGDGDGEPNQVVHDLSVHDQIGHDQIGHADVPGMFSYRELDAPPSDATLTALIETEIARVFDLARLPLLRFALFKLAPEDFLLIQIEQHYVHDGWSMNLLLRELLAFYEADADDALPPPAAQYREYALWQRSEAAQARFMAEATYWKRKLEGVSLELPLRTDFPRPAVPCYAGDQVRVVLPQALSRALRAFCRDEGVTLFAAMQAAYRMTIAYFAGSDDFLIGSAVGNRVWRKSESMVGMFVNMIPTRCDLSGDPTYRALIE